jgi:hypothetical protein
MERADDAGPVVAGPRAAVAASVHVAAGEELGLEQCSERQGSHAGG